MRRVILLALTAQIICDFCYGQNYYLVTFTDKSNSPYSLSQPSEFLSERAINRRVKNGVDILPEDLPITPAYMAQLKQVSGLKIHTKHT